MFPSNWDGPPSIHLGLCVNNDFFPTSKHFRDKASPPSRRRISSNVTPEPTAMCIYRRSLHRARHCVMLSKSSGRRYSFTNEDRFLSRTRTSNPTDVRNLKVAHMHTHSKTKSNHTPASTIPGEIAPEKVVGVPKQSTPARYTTPQCFRV